MDKPGVIGRLERYRGLVKGVSRGVRNPDITAREAIEIANYIAQLEADAERYRFIRNDPHFWMDLEGVICRATSPEDLDNEIDKARNEK